MNRINIKSIGFALIVLIIIVIACGSKAKDGEKESGKGFELFQKKAPKPTGVPAVLTTEEFIEKVHDFKTLGKNWKYKGSYPCVVDFYADWCRPCKMMEPMYNKLAAEYKDKIIFYKINIDHYKDAALAYGITSIPTFLFCPVNGAPQLVSGYMEEETFKPILEEILQ